MDGLSQTSKLAVQVGNLKFSLMEISVCPFGQQWFTMIKQSCNIWFRPGLSSLQPSGLKREPSTKFKDYARTVAVRSVSLEGFESPLKILELSGIHELPKQDLSFDIDHVANRGWSAVHRLSVKRKILKFHPIRSNGCRARCHPWSLVTLGLELKLYLGALLSIDVHWWIRLPVYGTTFYTRTQAPTSG